MGAPSPVEIQVGLDLPRGVRLACRARHSNGILRRLDRIVETIGGRTRDGQRFQVSRNPIAGAGAGARGQFYGTIRVAPFRRTERGQQFRETVLRFDVIGFSRKAAS